MERFLSLADHCNEPHRYTHRVYLFDEHGIAEFSDIWSEELAQKTPHKK